VEGDRKLVREALEPGVIHGLVDGSTAKGLSLLQGFGPDAPGHLLLWGELESLKSIRPGCPFLLNGRGTSCIIAYPCWSILGGWEGSPCEGGG